ncbi:MAG: right-handed parallel beta-helix repeat-containing protein [Planctomycetota bacterium]
MFFQAKNLLTRPAVWVLMLLAGCMLQSTAALADVKVYGIERGETVQGDLSVWASSNARLPLKVEIQLIGPDGKVIESRQVNGRTAHLIEDPDQRDQGLAWDSTGYPAGEYTLTAKATEWERTGRRYPTSVLKFTLAPPAATDSTDVDFTVTEAVRNTPEDSQVSATPDQTPDVEVAQDPQAAPAPAAELPSETITLEPQRLSSVQSNASAGPRLAWAAGIPTQRDLGDSQPINLSLTGDLSDGSDVLVIAWDHQRRRLVPGVSAVLTGKSLAVSPALMDRLPVGSIELQAHYREDGRIRQTIKHTIENRRPVVPTADDLPAMRFPANTPARRVQGSGVGLPFDVDGDLPAGGDILVIAWSITESRIVPGFAQVFTQAPFQISASKLDLLPPGRVEIQLRPRLNDVIQDKIVHGLAVETPASPAPDPATPATPTTPATPDTPNPDAPDSTQNPAPDNGSVTPGETDSAGTPDGNDASTPDAPATEIDAIFPASTPSSYEVGSGVPITIDVTADLPAGADVLMIAWDINRSRIVGDFAHELTSAPFRVDPARLDGLPTGPIELQALLRVPDQPLEIRKRTITIINPNAPEDDGSDVAEDDGPGADAPDFDSGELSATGFTVFKKSADTRVIYVAANGSDSNDGLSTSRPMKTAAAAYQKLRDGKPDWLLFKAGDTFKGNLGTVRKSGRSEKEPMLISTYGEGPRPIFLSPDTGWARKEFGTKGDNVAFVGLHLIAVNRDPNRPGFNAQNNPTNVWKQSGIRFLGDAKNVLIEDCILEYFGFGLVFQSDEKHGYARNIKIRRTGVVNSYSHWDKKIGGHSSGMYVNYVDGMLIEECVFDRNGWNPQVSGAGRTKFNHNIYVQRDSKNITLRKSILSRAASHGTQLRPGGVIEDSLYVGNALALYVARHESWVRRNVILKSDDLGDGKDDGRGTGIIILPSLHAHVEDNIVSQKAGRLEGSGAVNIVWGKGADEWLGGRDYRVSIRNNKIHDWYFQLGSRRESINIETGSAKIISNTGNQLDKESGGRTNPPWIDPDRDIETYMKSIGRPASLDALVQGAVYRPRGQWAKAYSAEAVNQHIRRGFDVQPFD